MVKPFDVPVSGYNQYNNLALARFRTILPAGMYLLELALPSHSITLSLPKRLLFELDDWP